MIILPPSGPSEDHGRNLYNWSQSKYLGDVMITLITISRAPRRLWHCTDGFVVDVEPAVRQRREGGEKREENSHPRNQCIRTHRIMCPHSTVLRTLSGDRFHLPFLSAGFSYSSCFYIQSEESSFFAIIAIIAFPFLRSRQWLPIASWISMNEIDHRLQALPSYPTASARLLLYPGFSLLFSQGSWSWLCT